MLRQVPTRSEGAIAPYERYYFGDWIRRRGCTTRQLVLIDEARGGRRSGCFVFGGRWFSVYDGRRLSNPSGLDIDHVVPLGEAWISGASRWTVATRVRFANDLGYSGALRAVTAQSNRSKSDNDPAEWLPPRQADVCSYIGGWIAVKYRWRLDTDGAERGVLRRYLTRCGRKADVAIPRRARVGIAKGRSGLRAAPGSSGAGYRSRPRRGGGGDGRRYQTCAQAKANGYGPYRRGVDREYRWYRDADRDGVVCE